MQDDATPTDTAPEEEDEAVSADGDNAGLAAVRHSVRPPESIVPTQYACHQGPDLLHLHGGLSTR